MSSQDQSAPSDKIALGYKMQEQYVGTEAFTKMQAGMRDDLPSRTSADFTAEVCFAGYARPDLSFRDRALMNIAMLIALNRAPQLTAHIRAALYNGLSEAEIVEACRHAMVYCGVPAGRAALAIASDVFTEWHESKGKPKQ